MDFAMFCQAFTMFFLAYIMINMMYHGVRQPIYLVRRWQARFFGPSVESGGDVEAGNFHPAAEGLNFELKQYPINLKSLIGVRVVYFSLNLSHCGHTLLKSPSALSDSDIDKRRNWELGKSIGSSFDISIDHLRRSLALDGRVYHDPYHPVIFHFEYVSETGTTYSTSFVIYHANSYVYNFKVCGKWMNFSDTPYDLTSEDGEYSIELKMNASYCDGCFDFVGVPTLIRALKDLNRMVSADHQLIWKRACLHLVFCFIESGRFTDIQDFVRDALKQSFSGCGPYKSVAVNDQCKALVNSWGTLSKVLQEYEETGIFKLTESVGKNIHITGETAEEQAECVRDMLAIRAH